MTGTTSEDACLLALRDAAAELGHTLSKAEYEALGKTPASATIIRVVGGWNEAKTLAGLETAPSSGSRVAPPPDDVPQAVRDRWESLSVDQRWHYRNKAWNATRTLRRRARLRAWLNDEKAAAGCARCGVSDPACLDFHHRDQEAKEASICTLVTNGYGRQRLRNEIEKCTVLCANCHRKEHFVDPVARFEAEHTNAAEDDDGNRDDS